MIVSITALKSIELKKRLYNSCLSICLLLSCNKHIKTDYPVEGGCEKFAGKYQMYDPQNNLNYELNITCIPRISNINEDSLIFINYANRFDFQQATSPGLDDPGHISGTIIQPLYDNYGLRWTFGNIAYAGKNDRYNRLVNDSLYVTFTIDNTAYYLEDSVPYYSCNTCTHYGIKIH